MLQVRKEFICSSASPGFFAWITSHIFVANSKVNNQKRRKQPTYLFMVVFRDSGTLSRMQAQLLQSTKLHFKDTTKH